MNNFYIDITQEQQQRLERAFGALGLSCTVSAKPEGLEITVWVNTGGAFGCNALTFRFAGLESESCQWPDFCDWLADLRAKVVYQRLRTRNQVDAVCSRLEGLR